MRALLGALACSSSLPLIAALGLVTAPTAVHARFNKVIFEACTTACESVLDPCNAQCEDACCGFFGCDLECYGPCYRRCLTSVLQCIDDCGAAASANIDLVGTLSRDGRRVTISGPIACDDGLSIDLLQVTVTQRGFAGVATGHLTRGVCEPEGGTFEVTAHARGHAAFRAGTVRVCAAVRIGAPGIYTDAHQWCQDVLLLPEDRSQGG